MLQGARLLSDADVIVIKFNYWVGKVYRMLASPSFAGIGLFPGNALREISTRALKLYGSCIDSSERTFLLSWIFSFINPCMKFP
jgi:hypothetical protein